MPEVEGKLYKICPMCGNHVTEMKIASKGISRRTLIEKCFYLGKGVVNVGLTLTKSFKDFQFCSKVRITNTIPILYKVNKRVG